MNDAGYEATQEGLARFLRRDGSDVGELGRSFILDHGICTARAIVLFHGMSASPAQFAAIAAQLHARGHNVFVPRLPHHGFADRMSPALADLTAEELKASLYETLEIAAGLGKRVTVAGFSLGGLLAAYAAQFCALQRAVAIVPLLGVIGVPSAVAGSLSRWALRMPNRFIWWDLFLREKQLPAHGYPRYATHALARSLDLARELMTSANKIAPATQELVVVINSHEPAVSNRAALSLARAWRARGAAVHVDRLRSVPFAHDIIEPKRYVEVAARLLPHFVEVIDGEA